MLIGAVLFVLSAAAENYPYRSDVLWVTVPDHADWLYKTGEKAKIEVQFYKYGIPQDGVEVLYELGGDMMPSDTKGTVKLKNGKAVISMGTMKEPGFRDCRLTAKLGGKTYSHHIKVGFSPEKLQPYTQLPSDFNEFWNKTKAEAARFPLTYTKEYVEKYSTDKIDCYLIRLQLNKQSQCIYGYLFYPKAEGKYPVVLCPPGAGIKTIKGPMRHKYYAEEGCIRFEIEIHGLNPELDEDTFGEISRAFSVQKRNTHGDGADVQMVMVDHIDRGHDIGMVQHDLSPPSDGVHGSENILPLDADGQAHLIALFCDAGLHRVKLRRACRPFNEHDHGKRALHDGLADLHDADVEFCQQRADLGDDADPVGADDGDNGFHVSFLLCADMEKGPCGPLFIFRISYARPASSSVR